LQQIQRLSSEKHFSLKNLQTQKSWEGSYVLPSPFSSLSSPLLLSPSAYASFEAPILLRFSLTLSTSLEAFYLLSLPSTQLSSAISLFHRIWIGSRVEFFEARSMFLHQFHHDTRLFIVFLIVFRLRQHQPRLLWTSTHRSVACTRQRVNLIRRRVVATFLLPVFPCFCCWLFAIALGVLCWREAFKCWRWRRSAMLVASVHPFRCCDDFIMLFLCFWAFFYYYYVVFYSMYFLHVP